MQKIFSNIEENYKEKFEELGDRRFHFASRLFLWKNDAFSKNKLDELKPFYIGNGQNEFEEIIDGILESEQNLNKMLFKSERERYFLRYPMLKKYNKILFKNLFANSIYDIDLKEVIEKKIGFEKLLEMKNDLENDPCAIAILSTHAVNFLYSLDFLLQSEESKLDVENLLRIAKSPEFYNDEKLKGLKLYFITHCVIGESGFYCRKITRSKDVYLEMISLAEKEILENFEKVSLDNKFEFLVCTKICGVKSFLEEAILKEANLCYNKENCIFFEKNKEHLANIKNAEHRNVLGVMYASQQNNFC